MGLTDAFCVVSAKANAAIASPFAIPAYIVVRVIMWRAMTTDQITLWLSDAAMLLLLLLSAEQNRQGKDIERHVKAISDADPKVNVEG